ncbi:MAG: hypothetical protein ACOYM3_15675 [Terrimicrobiaceae bacterium]
MSPQQYVAEVDVREYSGTYIGRFLKMTASCTASPERAACRAAAKGSAIVAGYGIISGPRNEADLTARPSLMKGRYFVNLGEDLLAVPKDNGRAAQ